MHRENMAVEWRLREFFPEAVNAVGETRNSFLGRPELSWRRERLLVPCSIHGENPPKNPFKLFLLPSDASRALAIGTKKGQREHWDGGKQFGKHGRVGTA